jgi:hypothetical protein
MAHDADGHERKGAIMVDDLTGLGKLAESQLARDVYADVAREPLKEVSGITVDFLKAVRLITAPFQLLAAYQDRLKAFCEYVRQGVPEERQMEASASIAGPILMDLRFMEADNPVTELFLNLLRRAIDRERAHEAHPAFVKIVEQLAPDEALILHWFKSTTKGRGVFGTDDEGINCFSDNILTHPDQLNFYLLHLETLGLCKRWTDSFVILTEFGVGFVAACVPDDFELISDEDLPPNPFPEPTSS